jgi:hypothetical protein
MRAVLVPALGSGDPPLARLVGLIVGIKYIRSTRRNDMVLSRLLREASCSALRISLMATLLLLISFAFGRRSAVAQCNPQQGYGSNGNYTQGAPCATACGVDYKWCYTQYCEDSGNCNGAFLGPETVGCGWVGAIGVNCTCLSTC